MDICLCYKKSESGKTLPTELVEKISIIVHKLNFFPCLYQITSCVVKIYSPDGYGFIVSNNHNYWMALENKYFIG